MSLARGARTDAWEDCSMRSRGSTLERTAALLVAAALSGCQAGEDDRIRDNVGLRGFASCEDLLAHVKAQASREMSETIDAYLNSLTSRGREFALPTSAPVPAPASSPGATDYTTTNTQERDVDEADVVKNDGSRIFVLHDRWLVALAAWPAAGTHVESVTRIEGTPIEMFLAGDTVVVFSSPGFPIARPAAGLVPAPYDSRMKVTVFDVSGDRPVL